VVDWIGVSVFQQVYPWSSSKSLWAGGSYDDVLAVVQFAKNHSKPIMIAESTPFGGIVDFHTNSEIDDAHLSLLNDPWKRWFEPVLEFIEKYDIDMFCYINCDWDSQPMWSGVGFGDTRISSNATVMKKWKQQVLDNPRFLGGGSLTRCDPVLQKYNPMDGIEDEGSDLLNQSILEFESHNVTICYNALLHKSATPVIALLFIVLLGVAMTKRRQTTQRLSQPLRGEAVYELNPSLKSYGTLQ